MFPIADFWIRLLLPLLKSFYLVDICPGCLWSQFIQDGFGLSPILTRSKKNRQKGSFSPILRHEAQICLCTIFGTKMPFSFTNWIVPNSTNAQNWKLPTTFTTYTLCSMQVRSAYWRKSFPYIVDEIDPRERGGEGFEVPDEDEDKEDGINIKG